MLRISLLTLLALISCGLQAADPTGLDTYQPKPAVRLQHPEWAKNAIIYQLNTRQFTPEGSFSAAEKQLPRLRKLGVDIVWLMPINPIGEKNRKGTLGSPYSVKDYRGVNPEFGTPDQLKHFINSAHNLGMHVILDWVANHTAWDHPWVTQHPEWYSRDWKGDFQPTPWWDWHDIINLDYKSPALRKEMTESLVYWVKEYGVDGYRADVAGFVPLDFWTTARHEMEKVKPVFLLAEWETRDMHYDAFDMTYAWSWFDIVSAISKGTAKLDKLFVYYSHNESAWPRRSMRMTYTSNHDANAWEGTDVEKFGDALPAATVLSFTGEGMPLIYNGQEAGNPKRLAFFEKDSIVWREHPMAMLYTKLSRLRKSNSALWNSEWGARMIKVQNNVPDVVLSFVRQNAHNKVFTVINFSPKTQNVRFDEALHHGEYTEFFSGTKTQFPQTQPLQLPAWSYRVYISP
jgi:glycosidase